jgi:multicomponent Na+:H+ antiporter subunit C
MESALAVLSGCLVSGGIYLLLSQHLVHMLFGLVLLSNAVNLILFTAGGLEYTTPAFIEPGHVVAAGPMANALPQALILTAIVIGFALLTFMFVLFYRSYQSLGTADIQQMHDGPPPDDRRSSSASPKERPS